MADQVLKAVPSASITPAEHAVVEKLGEAATAFAALPESHPSDLEEFVHAIHAAQNIVLARVGLRARDEAYR